MCNILKRLIFWAFSAERAKIFIMAAGNTRQRERKKNTTSIIEANIYSHLFIQMSLLAKEISERWWVVSLQSSELSGIWQYPQLHFKASIIRHCKPVVILPFSLRVDMFTRPLMLSLWSLLALVWSHSQNMPALVCKNSSQLSTRETTVPSKHVRLFFVVV